MFQKQKCSWENSFNGTKYFPVTWMYNWNKCDYDCVKSKQTYLQRFERSLERVQGVRIGKHFAILTDPDSKRNSYYLFLKKFATVQSRPNNMLVMIIDIAENPWHISHVTALGWDGRSIKKGLLI